MGENNKGNAFAPASLLGEEMSERAFPLLKIALVICLLIIRIGVLQSGQGLPPSWQGTNRRRCP